jgi:hypothetical protein
VVAFNDAPVLGPDENQFISRPIMGFGAQPVMSVQPSPGAVASIPQVDKSSQVDNSSVQPVAIVIKPPVNRTAGGRIYHAEHDRSERLALDEATAKMLQASAASNAATTLAKKAPETLVLIQSDTDNSTGASNAVEVHQTQDVIVSS